MSMTITVGAGNPGAVLIVIPGADLTDGEAWTLTGTAGYDSWDVRGGSGTGDGTTQVALIDPACPVNVTVTYTLTVGTTTATATTTRTYTGVSDIVSSLSGSVIAHTIRTSRGGDPRASVRRFHVSQVPGSSLPPMRLAPTAGKGGGSVQVITDAANSLTFEGLLATNAPLILLHNHSGCVANCTARATQMIYVTDDGNNVIGGYDTSQRVWDLSYILVADPEPDYRASLNTWGDVEAEVSLWSDAEAEASTWGEAEVLDWSTVGA